MQPGWVAATDALPALLQCPGEASCQNFSTCLPAFLTAKGRTAPQQLILQHHSCSPRHPSRVRTHDQGALPAVALPPRLGSHSSDHQAARCAADA